ncbi:MAG: ankyrin repeat domain-containing protein [Candidatus Aureabacteria bacterium]|nr:ankyrin repeat domain-containing protein [Candidatus Auribacterota bacterium]
MIKVRGNFIFLIVIFIISLFFSHSEMHADDLQFINSKDASLAHQMLSSDIIITGQVLETYNNLSGDYYISKIAINDFIASVWGKKQLDDYLLVSKHNKIIYILQKDFGRDNVILESPGEYIFWLKYIKVSEEECKKINIFPPEISEELNIDSSVCYNLISNKMSAILVSNPKKLESYKYLQNKIKEMKKTDKDFVPYDSQKDILENYYKGSSADELLVATNDFAKLMKKDINSDETLKKHAKSKDFIYSSTAKYLLKTGNYNKFQLVESNDVAITLIDVGYNINEQDENGDTSLHHALLSQNKELIKALVHKGANVNVSNNVQITPIFIALMGFGKTPDIDTVQLLIDHGAELNITNSFGYYPIRYVLKDENIEIVELLIENGANVNAKYIDGRTHLFHAIQNNQKKIVELLIEKGADVNIVDNYGETPISLANRLGFEEILNLLKIK